VRLTISVVPAAAPDSLFLPVSLTPGSTFQTRSEQSLSVLQVPAASPCGRSGAISIDGVSTDGASTEMLTAGASAGTTCGASGDSTLVERSSAMSPPPSGAGETSRPLPAIARPSAPLSAVPPSGAGTHLNVSVHINPGRHGSRGEQTLQSRFTLQASPSVTGTTRIATFKRTTSLFVISEVLGKGLRKLCVGWKKAKRRQDQLGLYSSAPQSQAAPMGRVSPSMSSGGQVVPPAFTQGEVAVRW